MAKLRIYQGSNLVFQKVDVNGIDIVPDAALPAELRSIYFISENNQHLMQIPSRGSLIILESGTPPAGDPALMNVDFWSNYAGAKLATIKIPVTGEGQLFYRSSDSILNTLFTDWTGTTNGGWNIKIVSSADLLHAAKYPVLNPASFSPDTYSKMVGYQKKVAGILGSIPAASASPKLDEVESVDVDFLKD